MNSTTNKLRIKQNTFDEIVLENIVDLDMQPEEAIQEAINQLTLQGTDLRSIVTAPQVTRDAEGSVTLTHPVVDAIRRLESLSLGETPLLVDQLQQIRQECNVDAAHRCLAVENDVVAALVKVWRSLSPVGDRALVDTILDALIAAGYGQPDAFDRDTLKLMTDSFEASLRTSDCDQPVTAIKLLKLMQIACKMHEHNRQALVELNAVGLVVDFLRAHADKPIAIGRACAFLRSLVLDDDVRVEFGRAHEHAKIIVNEHAALQVLAQLMKANLDHHETVSDIVLTLCRLVVRNEFCKEVADAGLLHCMLTLLTKDIDDQMLVKNLLHLVKTLAGNDEVKGLLVKEGGGPLVIDAMVKHESNPNVAEVGCSALAMMALRNPAHCDVIMESGAASAILRAMQLHKGDLKTQKQACLAIRNLVARTRHHCSTFVDAGAEALIRAAQATFPSLADETKAALRDLGLHVELKELWTGKNEGLK